MRNDVAHHTVKFKGKIRVIYAMEWAPHCFARKSPFSGHLRKTKGECVRMWSIIKSTSSFKWFIQNSTEQFC